MKELMNPASAVIESARLLRSLHALFVDGKDEGVDANAIREDMEQPWYAMTMAEQDRIDGLSIDLYAIAEGGPPRVDMNPIELREWQDKAKSAFHRYSQGHFDETLTFLRQPAPTFLPAAAVPFLQSRCWERLGDDETSLVFAREAEKCN